MRKKNKIQIRIKRLLKENNFVNNLLVSPYRKIKTLYRKLYFTINDLFIGSKIPSPEKIYWIDPKSIKYHTNYRPLRYSNFEDRVFEMKKHRGKIMNGDWDLTKHKFEDLLVYKAIKTRIDVNMDWCNTAYYQNLLADIKQGYSRFGCITEKELVERFQKLDQLIESIRKDGYKHGDELNTEISASNSRNRFIADEITVNIGRNGEYLFQNGRHRLSIALVLGITRIPVQVLVRHKSWIHLRKKIFEIFEKGSEMLYQPAFHPDFIDIPAAHDCIDRFEKIKSQLPFFEGTLLDVGSNLGYFCYKFDELGFQCTGIEKLTPISYVAEELKKSVNKDYKILTGNILDISMQKLIGKNYDIVLFLNILHHFLKEEKTYYKMTEWLKSLKTKIIFFEPHIPSEEQMQDVYINYDNNEFVNYIMEHTGKTKQKAIYKTLDGRTVFMLT